MGTLGRGLVAGAFGTLLLNAATYLDMALTGRPASTTPARTVTRAAGAVGLEPPQDEARLEAYGALGGIATGLGIGVGASLARSAGVRLPAPLGAAAVGGLAMLATDGPMGASGISDPRDWSVADWTRDVVPHLAYGAGVRWAMDRLDEDHTPSPPEKTPSAVGVVVRSVALGVAAGGRSTLALAGPVLATRSGQPAVAAAGLVAAELAADKLPVVPSRLAPGPLAGRVAGGALGAAGLARHLGSGGVLATLAAVSGGAGAVVGSVAGATWRDLAAERGWTWQAALVEDAVALGLTVGACRR